MERYKKKKDKYDEDYDEGMDEKREEEDGSKKKKRKKKDKDPNMPKKGLNPYMFFSQQKVREIRASDPLVQQKDALRQASAIWSGMSEAEKQPYVEMSARDKERHARELEEYLR